MKRDEFQRRLNSLIDDAQELADDFEDMLEEEKKEAYQEGYDKAVEENEE